MREHHRTNTGECSGGDRGQVVPLVALALWVIAGVTIAVAMVGGRAVARARAQSAADAVALGVAGGAESQPLADVNGAAIESVSSGGDVDVVVRIGDAVAGARARRARPSWEGLDPELQRALLRAESLLDEEITIVSGRRSRAEQEALWANRATNPYPVAVPGTSLHERGLAVDVPLAQAGRLAQISHLTGVCQPLPLIDPVHFILCQTTPTR